MWVCGFVDENNNLSLSEGYKFDNVANSIPLKWHLKSPLIQCSHQPMLKTTSKNTRSKFLSSVVQEISERHCVEFQREQP